MRYKPFPYDDEIGQEICRTIGTHSEGLKALCKKNPSWPRPAHIYTWMIENPSFKEMYIRAKQNQIESLVDDIVDIADDTSEDWIENDKGTIVANHDHINRARLRIDTRKWLAAKLCPRLYADKTPSNTDNNDALSQFRVEDK